MSASKDFMKNLRKEIGSVSFAESKFVEPSEWIDSGSYALNRIMSGDVYKAIPSGRIVILAGESNTAKSYFAAQVLVNAIMVNKYDMCFYFDSEGGALYDLIRQKGCDLKKIEHVLVDNIEDCTVKMLKTLNAIVNERKDNAKFKAICILDSLANLQPSKLMVDAVEKGRQVADQGGRARLCNQFVSGLTVPALRSDTPVVIINSIYDDTQAMYKSKLLNQSGGKKAQHVGGIIVQCTRKFEKDDNKDKNQFYKGTTFNYFTIKNRFAKQFYEADVYLDFKKGMDRYSGLFDLAVKYGLIKRSGAWYSVGDQKFNGRDELMSKGDEIWIKGGLLDRVNEISMKEMSYSETEIAELIVSENEELSADTENVSEAEMAEQSV